MTKEELEKLIKEEVSVIDEAIDHEGVRTVVNGASKLLKAVEAFMDSATGSMMGAVGPHVEALMASLENMVNVPASYVDKPKPELKVVKLRRAAD